MDVALRNVVVPGRPEQVWAVLADGWAYSDWVIGTRQILDVDDDWPGEGSSLRFEAGVGPVTVRDRTFVRISEPPGRLELEARALPVGTLRISIEVMPWGDEALVVIDEHPLRGPSLLMENPLVEGILTLRNRRMVRKLAQLVERRARGDLKGEAPAAPSPPGRQQPATAG
ncbi:MAG TPA: SRPBCC family protein [Acidimicrobiales bacterium]|nr:SRPBCC family protein [Acidimicrobiales bacterium]